MVGSKGKIPVFLNDENGGRTVAKKLPVFFKIGSCFLNCRSTVHNYIWEMCILQPVPWFGFLIIYVKKNPAIELGTPIVWITPEQFSN